MGPLAFGNRHMGAKDSKTRCPTVRRTKVAALPIPDQLRSNHW